VCIPGLHLSLGIFNRLYTLLEEASTELDLLFAEQRSQPEGGRALSSFERYSSSLRRLSNLKEEHTRKTQHASSLEQLTNFLCLSLPNPDQIPQIKALRQQTADILEAAQQMVRTAIILSTLWHIRIMCIYTNISTCIYAHFIRNQKSHNWKL
jgi:hypothetical protein